MAYNAENPLILQSDSTVLLEVDNPLYEEARDALARFAELEKSPEHIHTYRITPLSLWNAAAAGLQRRGDPRRPARYGKYDLPGERARRHRRLRRPLWAGQAGPGRRAAAARLRRSRADRRDRAPSPSGAAAQRATTPTRWTSIRRSARPRQAGAAPVRLSRPRTWPATSTAHRWRCTCARRRSTEASPFALRHYQQDAVRVFHAGGSARGGSGVIVLPCGAGKTLVGLGVMAEATVQHADPHAVDRRRPPVDARDPRQDRRCRQRRSANTPASTRRSGRSPHHLPGAYLPADARSEEFPHLALFNAHDWGLIIYDEVHLLPGAGLPRHRGDPGAAAPRPDRHPGPRGRPRGRRLLAHRPEEVRRARGATWRSRAGSPRPICNEVRVAAADERGMEYAIAEDAREVPHRRREPGQARTRRARSSRKHAGRPRARSSASISTSSTTIAAALRRAAHHRQDAHREREKLYRRVPRRASAGCWSSRKVANFSIDLPDANVAIQVSGTFGSRQEEAQRLGRILRPKTRRPPAHFYTLVTRDTATRTSRPTASSS